MSTRRWMIAVVLAGWAAINGLLLWVVGMTEFDELPMPTGGAIRIVLFTAMACFISPVVAILTLWLAIWTTAPESRNTRITGLIFGSAAAGFAGWSSATILLCIGHGANGQTPLAALLMGMMGAAVQIIPGAFFAGVRECPTRSGSECIE